MNRFLIYLVIWSVLLLGATADLLTHYPRLPERVATHFDGAGQADGWSTRSGFLWGWLFSVGFVPIIILGSAAAVKYLPARFINVPHREYWLGPERIEYTRLVATEMVVRIGMVLFLFLALLNHLTLRANLTPNPSLGVWPWVLVGGMLAAMAVIILPATLRFRRRN